MVRKDTRWRWSLLILLGFLLLAGCAKYQARSAFEEAEQLVAEEQYDQAVEKYFQATQEDPGNTTYKIKLASGRTRASAFHINKARQLGKEGKIEEALAEYRLARGFDPSLEVAVVEARQLEGMIKARDLAEQAVEQYREKHYSIARKTVKDALALDPQNARALDVQKQLDSKMQKVVMDGVELDVASDEPVTLRLKQANLKEVFGILGKLSGINFILDEEIKEKPITLLLEKGTFAQAMELILQMGEVGKKVLNGKTIIIYPQTKDMAKKYEDQIIQTFYLSHIDAKKAVNLLRTMLQLRKVYVHEERNALIIRDTPDTIKLAENLLKAADRADSEVLFDVEVLAVRDGDTLNIGPKLSTYGTKVGFGTLSGDGEDGGIKSKITVIPNNTVVQSLNSVQTFYTIPSIAYDFAKSLSTSEILASPKIRVKNNEKAKVHIGKRDPIVTTTGNNTNDNISQNVQYVDSGIKLDIEPNIQLDGTVMTKITLEVSNATRLDANNKDGTSPVAITTTNAQTSLVLIDGTRTILGGLYEINSTKNKTTFPVLGDIPLIGSLLSNFSNSEEKREIILSITPYIVKKVEVPAPDIATLWSGGEDDLMTRPKFGSFAQSMVSEVEATSLSASPAQAKHLPAPASALQGRVDPMPNRVEAEQLAGGDMETTPAADPLLAVAPEGGMAPSPGFTAESLLALPMPGAELKPQPQAPVVPPAAPAAKPVPFPAPKPPQPALAPVPPPAAATPPPVMPKPEAAAQKPSPVPAPTPAPVVPPAAPAAQPPAATQPPAAVAPAPSAPAVVPAPAVQPPAPSPLAPPVAVPVPASAAPPAAEKAFIPPAGDELLTLPPLPKPPPRLSFTGDTKVKAGTEFTLTTQVANVEKLYSAPLFVNYDPALLELVTVTEGDFLAQFGQTTVFSFSPNAEVGQVVIGYKQGVGGSGASGGGALFNLKFRGKAAGTTKVELNRINFRDPAGTRLNVEPATVNLVIK